MVSIGKITEAETFVILQTMKENVGTEDQILRSFAGTALLNTGYNRLGGKNGKLPGLGVMILGALLLESAITKVCPLNAALGINTKRKPGLFRRIRGFFGKFFSFHRSNLLDIQGEPIPGRKTAGPGLISNFGKNVLFNPEHFYTPSTEEEVLAILNSHNQEKIRAIGSLHAWSEAAASDGVIVDLRNFREVELEKRGDEVWAKVGAGTRIQDLISILHKRAKVTLPTLPAVTDQTIAGAISTATHGSGMPSMSNFIEEVRIAAYDSGTGRAKVYEFTEGPELKAARCALGCMGVILSVSFRCVPSYSIVQGVSKVDTLKEVLSTENDFPLQQTIVVPYEWKFYVYKRRPLKDEPASPTRVGYLFRAYWYVMIDLLFHATLIPLVNVVKNRRLTRWYLRDITTAMLWQAPEHTDDSAEILVLEHELFEHVEIEIFLPSQHLEPAFDLLQQVIMLFAGESERLSARAETLLQGVGMLEEAYRSRGSYFHHMPLLIRKILPDDALISMTASSEQPYYSVSIFTYYKDKTKFALLAHFLALSLNRLFGAKLHWGKHFPLHNEEIEQLYPGLQEFREICGNLDPRGVFRNNFSNRVLGFNSEENK